MFGVILRNRSMSKKSKKGLSYEERALAMKLILILPNLIIVFDGKYELVKLVIQITKLLYQYCS